MLTDRRIVVLILAAGAIAAETKSERTDCYGDPLPQGAVARMGTIWLRDHDISRVAFSPDGKLLAASSWGGTLRVWDTTTRKEIHGSAAYQDYRVAFAFAPDSRILAARETERIIRFWDLATGKQICALQTPANVERMAYSPNGKILAMIEEKAIRLWDVATGKAIRTIPAPPEGYRSLAFSPDGKMLATGGADQTDHLVWLWDVATGSEIRTLRQRPNWEKRHFRTSPIYVSPVAFLPDGKTLASAGRDAILMWDVASGRQLHKIEQSSVVACMALAPDGKVGASVDLAKVFPNVNSPRPARLWSPVTGKEIRQIYLPDDFANSLAFSPDGKILAGGDSNRVHLWDARTGKSIPDPRGHSLPVRAIAYSPDGKLLASGSEDQTVRLWDAVTGNELRIFRGHRGRVSRVAFSPDGKTLVSGSWDKSVRLWDVARGRLIRTLLLQERVVSVGFSPDGNTLATGLWKSDSSQQSLFLWDPFTGKKKPLRLETSDGSDTIAFAPNGRILASGGLGDKIHLLDAATGKEIRVLSVDGAWSIAFSPDGRLIASSSWAAPVATVRLWDADSGEQIHILRPRGQVHSVAFSPDGTLLATGGWDLQVHLWDVITRKEIYAFSGHRGAIDSLKFSPDGRRLASGSWDTSCLIWDVDSPFRSQQPANGQLSDQQRERLWTILGGSDALAAWRAVYTLAASLDQTVPFLDGHLQAPLVNADQIRRWIDDLDSDTYAVREAAQKELEQWGEVVAPALQQALQDKPSLEARKRMEHVLANRITRVPSGDYLATLRALTVLERIGTPVARRVLEKMAQGNPFDRRTREAKAALQRLAARRATMP